jgi:hypothetical protein
MRGRHFYDDVSDALAGFLPPSMRAFSSYRTSHNIKVWYGDGAQEHYEVQSIRRRKGYELEIGFHAEYRDAERNDECVGRIASKEKTWRKTLGAKPEVAPFVGYQTRTWRRVSEIWTEPVTNDPELAVDAAERLAAYIRALEPIRTG